MSDAANVIVPLYRLAHGRTGDKGDRSNISVIAWHPSLYAVLQAELTADVVKQCFAHRNPSCVVRYDLPNLHAFNFVIDDVLDGGVNGSLNLDTHGKALSYLLLDQPVQVPAGVVQFLKPEPDHF